MSRNACWTLVSFLILAGVGCHKEVAAPDYRSVSEASVDEVLSNSSTEGNYAAAYDRKFAIVIGVDSYTDESKNLRCAVNDASAFGRLLEEEFGYKNEDVRFLRDEQATLEAIRDAFTKWLQEKKPRAIDSVLVYFSGHGALVDGEGVICPADARFGRKIENALSLDWIVGQLDRRVVPSRHKLVILDCCFSGAIFARFGRGKDIETVPLSPGEKSASFEAAHSAEEFDPLRLYLAQDAFLGITAGRKSKVLEGRNGEKHSVFTSELIRVLQERADTERTDHAFTARRAAAIVEARVANRPGSTQRPDWGYLAPGDGDFLFRPVPEARRMTPSEISFERWKRTKHERYAADMASAFDLLSIGKFARADNLLSAYEADDQNVRGWEWHYATKQSRLRSDSELPVGYAVAWSPDSLLVAVGADNEVIVCDASNGRVAYKLPTPAQTGRIRDQKNMQMMALAWGENGSYLAAADDWGAIHVWDAASHEYLSGTESAGSIGQRIEWHDDSEVVVVEDIHGRRSAWNRSDMHPIEADKFASVTNNAKRQLVADWAMPRQSLITRVNWFAGGISMRGEERRRRSTKWKTELTKPRTTSQQIASKPEDRERYSRSLRPGPQDATCYVVDSVTGMPEYLLRGYPLGELSPDNKRVVLASGTNILALQRRLYRWSIWSAPSLTLAGHAGPVEAVCWLGEHAVASVGQNGTIEFHDTLEGKCIDKVQIDAALVECARSPVSGQLAVGGDGGQLFTIGPSGKKVTDLTSLLMADTITALAWHPSRKELTVGYLKWDKRKKGGVSIHGDIAIIDVEENSIVQEIRLRDKEEFKGFLEHGIYSAAWDRTGKVLAVGGAMEAGYKRDRRSFASANGLDTRAAENRLDKEDVSALATKENGIIGFIHDGQEAVEVMKGHAGDVTCVKWSPSGEFIASCGRDRRVMIWNSKTRKRVHSMLGHQGVIYDVTWHPNERRIASASYDGTVRLWDTVTGREVALLKGHAAAVTSVAWNESGTVLVSGGADCRSRLWAIPATTNE